MSYNKCSFNLGCLIITLRSLAACSLSTWEAGLVTEMAGCTLLHLNSTCPSGLPLTTRRAVPWLILYFAFMWLFHTVCLFPVALMTKCFKLSAFKQRKPVPAQSQVWNSGMQGLQGPGSRPLYCPLVPAALPVPQRIGTSPHSLLVITQPTPPPSVSFFSPFNDTGHWIRGPSSYSSVTPSYLIIPTKHLFHNKFPFKTWGLGLGHAFLGTQFNPQQMLRLPNSDCHLDLCWGQPEVRVPASGLLTGISSL